MRRRRSRRASLHRASLRFEREVRTVPALMCRQSPSIDVDLGLAYVTVSRVACLASIDAHLARLDARRPDLTVRP